MEHEQELEDDSIEGGAEGVRFDTAQEEVQMNISGNTHIITYGEADRSSTSKCSLFYVSLILSKTRWKTHIMDRRRYWF